MLTQHTYLNKSEPFSSSFAKVGMTFKKVKTVFAYTIFVEALITNEMVRLSNFHEQVN